MLLLKKEKVIHLLKMIKEGKWHGTPPFNVKNGRVLSSEILQKKSWSEIISDQVLQWMKLIRILFQLLLQ